MSLPKDENYILVDFSNYVKAVDAQLSEMTPIVDNIMSPNVTYPIMKYEVSPSKTLEAGLYLYHVTRFIACNDTCDVSVLIKDNTEPHILNCPDLSQNLYGEECRDVNLYDYYSKSRISSCFGDNVGIKDVICRQTHLDRIAIGETAHITCYATDIAGTSSASYNITFHCKKNVCPPLKPPTHGAFVCHEDNLVQRCILFCREDKVHKRRNIFECDMTNPSSTWTGAGVDDIICQNRGRHKQRFTFNMSCDSDDLDFHREVKRTLSGTRNGHQLCHGMSDDDCEITVSCGNCSYEEDRESNCTENGMIVGETNGAGKYHLRLFYNGKSYSGVHLTLFKRKILLIHLPMIV
ncbi:uncharacterized protein LOC118423366 [Branchiostoma floridae]|uniref:Uncharacterized protein LOC118423366 n=1 Tax=Branchiostoma floridae TaxID=7739 RepID=A0A9J7LSC2_BRAFL|nr:uncharacterized protein LOC118423366 [Branchiostoma floridae]